IYDMFQQALDSGASPQQAITAILQDNRIQHILTYGGDSWEDETDLYIALADLQLQYNILQPDIRDMAIQAIETVLAFDDAEATFGHRQQLTQEQRQWLMQLYEHLSG
ncbi:MAG: hypothetical protein CUN56_11915, partial [Phototrophicales bacterium]